MSYADESIEATSQFYRGLFIGIGSAAIGASGIAYILNKPLFSAHEGLIGSALTIAAGFLPVWIIYRQIVVTVNLAKTERESRLIRSRALLSMPLLDLSDYASESIALLETHYPRAGTIVRPLEIRPILPHLPRDAITTVAETCGFVSRKPVEKAMADLITIIQVQRSRTSGFFDSLYSNNTRRMFLTDDLDDYILDSIEINARCAGMFAFARFDSEEISLPDADSMRLQARIAHITQSQIFEKIRRRWNRSPN